ncbi:MAG: hypothetical protein ACI9NT_001295 [Bacteroidia bacterium]
MKSIQPLFFAFLMVLWTQAQAQNWDHTDVKYGTDDPNRQWLNIHLADTVEPAPVYMFAHGNGGTPDMPNGQLDTIAGAGYTTVSWESVPSISQPEDLQIIWSDAQLVFDWIRANAATYNIDPDNIIVGGRSRGSGGSWPLAQSGHPAIKGIYMYNVLPEGFWQFPDLWTPLVNVSADSPPTYFAFGPNPQSDDGHNPVNAYPVRDRYIELGIGDNITLTDSMWDNFRDENDNWKNVAQIMEYFPGFVATLDSSEPANMVDNFDGGNTDYLWTGNGTWYISGDTYNQDDTTGQKSTYAGNTAWDAYTFKADMITVSSANPAIGWMASSLAFRVSDSQNMYLLRLHSDGVLKLRTSVNGVNSVIASVATGYSPFAWHTYKIVVASDSIKASIDDELLIDVSDSDHSTGGIGVLTSQSSVSVDNIAVTQPPGC